ncbi:MAG: sigma-54-dependent Fis family transcriptional regulator, partial [Deltaproteobacteria bacterium]|nr:sigma-54-dependent Fis family transcriptional regulator [Deltaproteobacteria bacterium]
RIDSSVPVVIMTAFGSIEGAVEAMRRGAFHYLSKPFELGALRILLERACRERRLEKENASLRRTLHESLSARRLVGQSAPMRQLRALIERVADAAAPVLISGETGTGKELVALAIHTDGPRGDRPFVAINCAALPEQLLESELFGHTRGAFTGASQNRRGLFLEAEGGTLFLDEIGDLPLSLQGKLLRVLQSGEVRAVGSETIRTVDVRCISATHKDLAVAVERGLFREDLFFRLDVLRVSVPPVRERSDDIPALIEHVLRKILERSPRASLVGFEPDALDFLITHNWPGNVRQIENLIERLVVTTSTPLARLADVKHAMGSVRESDPIAPLLQRNLTLQDLEDRYIDGVLQKVGGNKAKAAEILGIDISTLYRKEKQRT